MNIKNLRAKTPLSQAQFAKQFNIPVSTLKDWEQQRRTPPSYVIDMMENVLKENNYFSNNNKPNNVGKKNIAIVGIGYVGAALMGLLGKTNNVNVYDINKEKLDLIKEKKAPIKDELLSKYLVEEKLHINVCDNLNDAIKNAEYALIATPTDYDETTNSFNTSSVEETIKNILDIKHDIKIIIKSTVPVNFTNNMIKKYHHEYIYFVPEFLREGKALYDNLYPSRIVVGVPEKTAKHTLIADEIIKILAKPALKENIKSLIIANNAAEASKLFANSYLAMRVAFFNELDSYAETNDINTRDIIDAISLDERIGKYYNNPSFGYGGYCLPKDSKQLKASFGDVPNKIISSIVDANEIRKEYIADQIVNHIKGYDRPLVGIYRLTMKTGSDNFRQSSIIDVMEILKERLVNLIIYEPNLEEGNFKSIPVTHNLKDFKNKTALIVTNRYDENLEDVKGKIYTRDIFNKD